MENLFIVKNHITKQTIMDGMLTLIPLKKYVNKDSICFKDEVFNFNVKKIKTSQFGSIFTHPKY